MVRIHANYSMLLGRLTHCMCESNVSEHNVTSLSGSIEHKPIYIEILYICELFELANREITMIKKLCWLIW